MKIHVIVPTHNRTNLLVDLLESLKECEDIVQTEITVIENGSTVAQTICERYVTLLPLGYVHLKKGNKSLALNQAISSISESKFIIFFDDDVQVLKGTISAYKKAAEKFGPGHFFGGVVLPRYETVPSPNLVKYMPASGKPFDLSESAALRTVNNFRFFLGANWGAYASDLAKIGYFSSDYGPGAKSGTRGQETEAQNRLIAAGCEPVFVRNAVVKHFVPVAVTSPKWINERCFNSAIYQGENQGTLLRLIRNCLRIFISVIFLCIKPSHFGSQYRLNKGLGYLKGFVRGKTDSSAKS